MSMSQTHNVIGQPYLKFSEITVGSIVHVDWDWCRSFGIPEGNYVVQIDDVGNLFIPCPDGKLILSGQVETPNGSMIGIIAEQK